TARAPPAGARRAQPPARRGRAAGAWPARLSGLDFLDELIRSGDFTDIKINADGRVWTRAKGVVNFRPQPDLNPDPVMVERMANALLAPMLRACTEATPSVDAKIPRGGRYGGARVKVLHPVICGGRSHHIDIRLFEPKPVDPQQILDWGMCPKPVLDFLLQAVREDRRIMISGGTGTGKTTLLSALLKALPPAACVVKIEDPEEIWLQHPNVETLERRPAPPGSATPPYEVDNAVDDAMRMSPSHLIVGEVRTGQAAFALFRALMSDHAGGTTFHASSAHDALGRLGLIMFADKGVAMHAGRQITLSAIDLIVQIGIRDGVRRILNIHELRHPRDRKQGDGDLLPLWHLGEDPERMPPIRRQRDGTAPT
ncbi:MAG: ATPase, T2SS/T4P/T4SS family, partial [Caldilineaceae bacterium]|nr:ATPase, T2SS/T4P/T4SS family [Caldilineaceae bacterium]